jgi:hypothetical protein
MSVENKGPGGVSNSYGQRRTLASSSLNTKTPKDTYTGFNKGNALSFDATGRSYYDTLGQVRPISEAYSIASKSFPKVYEQTSKQLNLSLPTFTTTATGGTEIYIDFNRGNDANPGTRLLPKKNLSAINSASYGAGSIIALASDSVWDLVGTTTTVNQINCDNILSTNPASPVLITGYDAAGHTGLKPTVIHSWKPAANEWVYDAAAAAWYYTITNALYPGANCCIFVGPNKLPCINVWQDASAHLATNPPMFRDYQFSFVTDNSTYKKIYLWSPANTNPTDYYGGVMLSFGARGALFTGSNGLRNTIIDGLKFAYTGSGIGITATVGGTAHTGLIVRNCDTDRAGLLDYYNGGSGNANSFVTYDNKGVEVPSAFIKASGQSGNTTDYDIRTNDIRGGNRQYSAQAAIYITAIASALGNGKVHHNYIYDCQNGTGTEFNGMPGSTVTATAYGCPYDGSAIYFDLGSNRGVAYGNIIERCHVAIQTNSAKTVQVFGNITIDCNLLGTSTDAGAAGSNDVLILHNTYINRLVDQNQLKQGTTSKADYAYTNWFENTTSSSIRVINNAFYRKAQDGLREAIRIERDAGTKLVVGNALYGWTNAQKVVAKRLIGPEVDDLTATALNVTSDGAFWFDGLTSVPVSANSPLVKAGNRYIDGLADMTGTAFERIPSIGAIEWTPR